MLEIIRTTIKQKGQGIVEYALLLAFVVGIGMMMSNSNLGSALKGAFDDVAFWVKTDKTYSDYFHAWRKTPLNSLKTKSAAARLKADQEALAILARFFIGKDEAGVKTQIEKLTAKGNKYGYEIGNSYKEGSDGYSGVMIPLSYQLNSLDGETGFIWLDSNKNVDAVKLLSSDANVYKKDDKNNPYSNIKGHEYNLDGTVEARTVATDRLFYSNDMINDSGQKTVALQVHYSYDESSGTKKVDSVKIAAYNGKANSSGTVAQGLNLNVTNTDITEITD